MNKKKASHPKVSSHRRLVRFWSPARSGEDSANRGGLGCRSPARAGETSANKGGVGCGPLGRCASLEAVVGGGAFRRVTPVSGDAGSSVVLGFGVRGLLDVECSGWSSHSPQYRHFTALTRMISLQNGQILKSASFMAQPSLRLTWPDSRRGSSRSRVRRRFWIWRWSVAACRSKVSASAQNFSSSEAGGTRISSV